MNKKYTVFISSTYTDLQEERKKVMEALLQMNCFPVGMEYFNASDDSQWTVIKNLIDECDYYVLIIAGRYGSIEKASGKSYTQKEFEYAQSIGVPILSFVHKDISQLPSGNCETDTDKKEKLEQFKEIVKQKVCKFWTSSDELASQVVLSLNSAINTYPRIGWIRADGLSDEESTKEILQLKKENEVLKKSLKKIEEENPNDIAEYSQGNDPLEINFKCKCECFGVSTTWDTIFSVLCPLMLIEESEGGLRLALQEWARYTVNYIDKFGYVYEFVTVFLGDFEKIMVQLIALRMIEESNRKHGEHDYGRYWTLTQYGKRYLIKNQAIKR